MDHESLSSNSKIKSRRRFQYPLSSHIDFTSDLECINQDIRRYRALYFSIATYVGTFTLLQFGFIRYLRWCTGLHDLVNIKIILVRTAMFILPWVFKPVLGYLSDMFFPFYRRFKGYAIILGTVSIFATGINSLYAEKLSMNLAIFFCFLQVLSLVWVDSLAQGMIAVSLRFEDRKEEMLSQASEHVNQYYKSPDSVTDMTMGLFRKPFQATYKYANSFGYFTAWVTLVRGVFEFIAAFMFDIANADPNAPTNMHLYLKLVYMATLPFMMIMVLCFIFIPELRQQSLFSKTKPGSIFK